MTKHAHNLINNSMQHGLQMNLKDAIEDCGIKIPSSVCVWEYPEVIRKNLVAKTVSNINIKGNDIINVTTSSDDDSLTYNISTIYDITNASRPNYAPDNNKLSSDSTVKDVIDDLFVNILPAVKGVHAGDMTVTDENGNDTKPWVNTIFNTSGYKTGLSYSAKYIRLYLTCQSEPIYINIGNLAADLTKGYNVVNSDTVTFELNSTDMTMKAHISNITNEQINNL